MTAQILVAPAGAGKTEHVLNLARRAAAGLSATPHVVVPSGVQVRSCRRRLALTGGALGVRLETFERLQATLLNLSGEVYTELSEPVRHRLIRSVVDGLPLQHFAAVSQRPGFILVLQDLIAELKAALVEPTALRQAVAGLGAPPRLAELAGIYAAYQCRLQEQGWADRAGLGWLAVQSLERHPALARDWPFLIIDGFDSFTPTQLALLETLAGRVGHLVVTITGDLDGAAPRLVHHRFAATLSNLTARLHSAPTPLPIATSGRTPVLVHLEASLFGGSAGGAPGRVPSAGAVELLETPDRAAEARAALRWLKERVVVDGTDLGEVALLARNITPYRDFIQQAATEFGLPVRLASGSPLRGNPAVAALLDLMRLSLPLRPDWPESALPRRLLVEAWRSPYFDWSMLDTLPDETAGTMAADADALDAVAHWGRIIGGQTQWEQELSSLAAYAREDAAEDENAPPVRLPVGAGAQALLDRFHAFLGVITPPAGQHGYRGFVAWLEQLIGADPAIDTARFPAAGDAGLRVVARARQAAAGVAARDIAALQSFKEVLGGLVWAEQALGATTMDFPRFFDDLVGAVEAQSFQTPITAGQEEILVANVAQARGVPFRAIAVMGLAEGEFPAALTEDPFLRDSDRQSLRQGFGLPLEPSLRGGEVELFYETLARASQRLLLTRPRLADNGSLWQASPYWEELLRRVEVTPQGLTSQSVPTPGEAASWPELMEGLAVHDADGQVRAWAANVRPDSVAALDLAAAVLRRRGAGHLPETGAAGSQFDGVFGDGSGLAGELARRFGPATRWSPSRLETYRTCPFFFFVGTVLGLEPREEPEEGMDARQMGTLYHALLERVYRNAKDPADLASLEAALDAVAPALLDAAPKRLGFRATAWWMQTREEITEDVRRSLAGLAAIQGDFKPLALEAAFGLHGKPRLMLRDGDDSFFLGGIIDRVDRDSAGRLRLIDYKSGGPSPFTVRAAEEGKKLQLALYALAARDALGLGQPVDGFYWHVRQAKPSTLRLQDRVIGPDSLLDVAIVKSWEAVRGARGGLFAPCAPDDGCPSYCPAVGFCWRYRPGFGG
jgi:ATP-dependent helicase/DNAse subunit B